MSFTKRIAQEEAHVITYPLWKGNMFGVRCSILTLMREVCIMGHTRKPMTMRRLKDSGSIGFRVRP